MPMRMPMRMPALLRLEPFAEFEDPDAAPGAFRAADPAPRWSVRRAVQNHLAMYIGGLVFMIYGIIAVVEAATSVLGLVGGEAVVALLSVLYVGAAFVSDARLRVRWAYVGLFGAVSVATATFLGLGFTSFGVFFAILLATLIPWRTSRLAILLWGLALVLLAAVTANPSPALIGAIALGVGVAVGAGIEQGRVAQKLRRLEVRASQLAVVAERERIARDLHDILGHSLTAASIKSGLAVRLIEVDPAGAKAQITEVETIVREALADVRSTASGMRRVRLTTEIAGARSVLAAAGIEAITPSAVEPMAESMSESLGYVVREAVTNVVRHSEATRCVITAGPGWVAISDNGGGLGHVDPAAVRAGGLARGSGLSGLRERIEGCGGRLIISSETSPESGHPAGTGVGLCLRAELGPVGPGPSALEPRERRDSVRERTDAVTAETGAEHQELPTAGRS